MADSRAEAVEYEMILDCLVLCVLFVMISQVWPQEEAQEKLGKTKSIILTVLEAGCHTVPRGRDTRLVRSQKRQE